MNKELKQVLVAALNGVAAYANFSAEETDKAAVNALLKEIGIDENSTGREIRAKEDLAFILTEDMFYFIQDSCSTDKKTV